MWPVASSSGCAVTSSSVPMCDIIPVRKNLHVAALHLGLVSANATDWCLTFDQRHRVSTVHLVIARAYFIVVGAWVSGLYYARGYLGGGILLGEVLQTSWLTQAFLGIAVKESGAKYGVAVD